MQAIRAVFYRDYKQRMTNIGWVFWDLFVPVMYLVLFGLGFERMIGGAGHGPAYSSFLLGGVLAMTAFGVAMNTSWGIFMDKDSGIFYEMLTYPITRHQLLIGKVSFNLFLSLTGSTFVLIAGALIMDVPLRIATLPLTLLIIAITTAGWFFFFSFFVIRLRRMDSFNTFSSAAYIILMFLSTMFYPIDQLPSWFRYLAMFNPMTWQVDALRWSTIGTGSALTITLELGAFIVFGLVALTLSVREMNRAGD